MFFLAKYGVQTTFYFPMVKRGVVDLAATADWTPATGDTKVTKDGGAVANTTNNPTAVTGTGSVGWALTLTATELTAADVQVQIVDSATKAIEDQFIVVYTYGNASAKIKADLSDSVRLGLTALPNAAAEAAGGLYTRGSGAGQVAQDANGRLNSNVAAWLGTAPLTPNTAGLPLIDLQNWLGVAPLALTSQQIQVSVKALQAAVITAAAHATDAVDANALAASAVTEIVAGVRAMAVDGTTTIQQAVSIILAAISGITTGGGLVFKAPDGTTTRLTVTTDASNNRTASTLAPAA